MSRRQLAEQMGVHENAIVQWEHGLRTPGSLELAKMCRELAVPCDVFTQALLAADPAPQPTLAKGPRGRPPKKVRDAGKRRDKSGH